MNRVEYAEKCIAVVAVMREAAEEDPALALFLNMFDLLKEPVFEEPANG